MPSYDWERFQGQPWADRFPSWAVGVGAWQQHPWTSTSLPVVASRYAPGQQPPRVFISHQQRDTPQARRIAWLADQEGFEFWLDVLDPTLIQLQLALATPLSPAQQAVALASVIEMGLHNSSHVLALITPNSLQSRWVPYEYGRVPRAPNPWPASAWIASTVTPPLPEYLHLGALLSDERTIRLWLQAERGGGPAGPAGNWKGAAPRPL